MPGDSSFEVIKVLVTVWAAEHDLQLYKERIYSCIISSEKLFKILRFAQILTA